MIWVHIAWTLALITTFVVIVLWAWSGKQKKRFDAAAQIPLQDDHFERPEATDQ